MSDANTARVVDGDEALTDEERLDRELDPNEDPSGGTRSPESDDPSQPPKTSFDLLRDDYAAAVEENEEGSRSEDWEVMPGRFHGRLGMRSQNVDDKVRRRIARQMGRRGNSQRERLLNAQAAIIAEATSTMLMRDDVSGEWIPLHEHPDCPADFRGSTIVWDDRLAAIIGFDYPGTPFATVRLTYRTNPSALSDHYNWLDAWLKEELVTDDEEEEGGDRPT
jgi:hypothetical protein